MRYITGKVDHGLQTGNLEAASHWNRLEWVEYLLVWTKFQSLRLNVQAGKDVLWDRTAPEVMSNSMQHHKVQTKRIVGW